jgi:PAS domain S-box-containing protein
MRKTIKFPEIKLSIFGKLLIGIFAILVLLLMITFVSINRINNLEKDSHKMLDVSITHYNINSLRMKIHQLLMPVNDFLIHGNEIEIQNYQELLIEIESQLKVCEELIINEPDHYLFIDFPKRLEEITVLAEKILSIEDPVGNNEGSILMETIDFLAERTTDEIDDLLLAQLLEIEGFIIMNQTGKTKANRIIILLGLVTAISLLIGGFFYVKEITSPIKKLLDATEKVSSGDLSVKADVKTKTSDEIEELANSFNSMMGVLEKSTVAREFLHNIISRMIDTIIVTGASGTIRMVNQASLDLLGYEEEELIGRSIHLVLKNEEAGEIENVNNIYNTYYSKEGKVLPVLFSRSIIYNGENKITGMVFIASNYCAEAQKNINQKNGSDGDGSSRNIKAIGETPLTSRELEIIKLITEGLSNREIANKLFISVRTVETHRKNLMQKLHIKSVISMVHYAVQNGII